MAMNRKPRKKRPIANGSLHETILAELQQKILSGKWPPGHKIPFEHELTTAYRCSRMTVNKVITQLAAAGLVERRRKAGTFVARPRSQSAVLEVQEIRSEVAALGIPYRFEVLHLTKRHANSLEREQLGSDLPKQVIEVVCLHFAGNEPFCLEERVINLSVVPDAAFERFEDMAPGPWLSSKIPWTAAENRIKAISPSRETAATLHIRSTAPCLAVERRTWYAAQPVTFVRLTYPGTAHQLIASFEPKQPFAKKEDVKARRLANRRLP